MQGVGHVPTDIKNAEAYNISPSSTGDLENSQIIV